MAQGSELAGIEYHGVAGASHECLDAVMRLLQFGDSIVRAHIVSYSNRHSLLLTNAIGDRIVIKCGFSSGYVGEGPRRFSYALLFLEAHGAKIDECAVDEAVIVRLDNSALTISDIGNIDAAKPIRPQRWDDYVLERPHERARAGRLWDEFPRVMPFAIVDNRIIDLALSFWENPDDKLLKGYRRLEDLVRERAGLDEHGAKLFAKAFAGLTARLYWKDLDDGEKAGRVNLFTGAYMAHRNPRAHRELQSDSDQQLTEFLLLNHLYRLEKEAQSTY
jgi:hypothetical protein